MHELYHKYIIMHLYLQKYRVKKRFSLCDKIAEINEKKKSQLFCSFGMFGFFFSFWWGVGVRTVRSVIF